MINNDFCAKKMRDLACQTKKELEDKEFQETTEKITAAAKQGLTKIKLFFIYNLTKTTLEDLGFKIKMVDYITNYNSGGEDYHTYYEVSWDGE